MQPCDHTSVGVLAFREGKLLLIDRKKPPYGLAAPSGHVDDHGAASASEEARYQKAAIDELREETGLTATTLTLVLEGRKENPCRRGGDWHYWRIYTAETTGEVHASEDETRGHLWCDPGQMSSLLASAVVQTEHGEIGLEPVWKEWLASTKIAWNLISKA
ncbi:MAG: NUDIX domain-containing protein [Patescibacteria group bacterium]